MSDIPIGAKVAAILFYISAGLGIIGSLFLILGGSLITPYLDEINAMSIEEGGEAIPQDVVPIMTGVFVVIGVIILLVSVLEIFVGMSIWKLKKWAQITGIILASLGFLYGLVMLIAIYGIVYLIWNGIVIYFLAIDKKTREAFTSSPQ